MPDLSVIRARTDAVDVRWVLFIDGIPYAFTSDVGTGGLGSLIGSGASSWIGLSEAAIGGVESVGARRVLAGLELPGQIPMGVDPKSGDWEPNPVTFRLHDLDGLLAPLFATEGKEADVLRQRIAPGTSALAATALGQGGTTIDIWGRNIGLERIGAAGQRRLFPFIPYSLVGLDHAVHQNQDPVDGLPPVLVSDEPIAWTGRLVSLYEIYRDPDSTATTAAAWPTWDLQHAAENLVWCGKIIGVDRVMGGTIDLRCHGPDGLIRKQLGVVSSNRWQRVTAELNYGSGEDSIAVYFEAGRVAGASPFVRVFNGSIFDNTLTATNQADLIAEIDGIIQDAFDGTSTNYVGGDGDLDAWTVGAVAQNASVGVEDNGFYVRKAELASDQHRLVMLVALHARVWRQLGYEPETQNYDARNEATTDSRQIRFQEIPLGHSFGQGELDGFNTGEEVPASGYWVGRFTSVALGYTEGDQDSNEWDNGGFKRVWTPKFIGEPFTLDLQGGQIVRLGEGISPYIEGDLAVPHEELDVDGNTSERARFFAFRGKVQRVDSDEVEDTVQVWRCEWAEGNHGTILPGTGALPALLTRQLMDPRIFGFNHRKLTGLSYWTGTGDGEGAIEAVPLNAHAFAGGNSPEWAGPVWSQILLSTGSSPGWSGLMHTDGANAPTTVYADARYWGSDTVLADQGCGVPYQLVASQSEINEAFNTVPGGWNGNLNRVRHAYVGPYLAQDVFLSLMRPRRLMWRWHGGQYGVTKLGPFSPSDADLAINEIDLYPTQAGDPLSLIPEQQPNPVGHLDAAVLDYGWDPEDGRTSERHLARARDAGATQRTGELEEPMVDTGLVPYDNWGPWDGVPAFFWTAAFDRLWSIEAAEFFSLDHYSLTLNVSRPKGQDCRPGTRVLISNPWPLDNAGGRGINNHVGFVYEVQINTVTHARMCRTFVFAGQAAGAKHFAGSLKILDQSGAVLTVDTDQHRHGNANLPDTRVLTEPWWSSTGGSMRFRVLTRIGDNYTLGATVYQVSSFDGTDQVTLNSAPPTTDRYADRWLWPAPYADQNASEWPREIFGVIVQDDQTHGTGGGVTAGRPFHP